jgi:hypothetical protein
LGPKAIPQANLPLVTSDGYIKQEPVTALDTRALPEHDNIITQWLIQWENLDSNQATWEDKNFVKTTFPQIYLRTIKEWWPTCVSCGQENSQGGRGCHTPGIRATEAASAFDTEDNNREKGEQQITSTAKI